MSDVRNLCCNKLRNACIPEFTMFHKSRNHEPTFPEYPDQQIVWKNAQRISHQCELPETSNLDIRNPDIRTLSKFIHHIIHNNSEFQESSFRNPDCRDPEFHQHGILNRLEHLRHAHWRLLSHMNNCGSSASMHVHTNGSKWILELQTHHDKLMEALCELN